MAWRIHEHVSRGKIDNCTRGRVTGEIWLAGIEEPLVLDLSGDCEPDLAGCRLSFENPTAIPMKTKPLAVRQRGPVGEITAARKARVFDIPLAEAWAMLKRGATPPEHMANSLRIEWFSRLSGRVIIESSDYRLQISEAVWRFTAAEIAERKRRAAEEDTAFAIAMDADGNAERWDEVRCEQLLRESDALTEKFGRLLEKYGDDPDSERLIAREMGWTWLEKALDANETRKAPEETAELGEDVTDAGDLLETLEDDGLSAPDSLREGVDWVRDGRNRISHPIKKRADEALHALIDELKAAGHFPHEEDEQLGDFVSGFMTITAKLAGALGGVARGDHYVEPGLVIAWLKRILEILHQTLSASDSLAGKPFLAEERLRHYQDELFAIREAILALIAELRWRH